jgi:uncharacterized membrane protein
MIFAALAAAVTMFLLGWVLFGMLLMDFYKENSIHYEGLMKEMPNIFLIFVSNLLFSFLLSFIYSKWANISTFGKGFTYGLLIGFLIMTAFDMYFLAGMNLFNGKLIIIDIILNTLMVGIAGGVAGLVLGLKKKTA